MREVQASEAKTHLPRLLDDVERGETLRVTRHGRAIARIVPEGAFAQDEVARAVAGLRAVRRAIEGRGGPGVTWEELRLLRDDGRR